MPEYMPRIIDRKIGRYSKVVGAIHIKGPKFCGKTTTAEQHAKKVYRLSLSRVRDEVKLLLDGNPSLLFKKEDLPILFDEWVDLPEIWDEVRTACDELGAKGAFYLTGSKSLLQKEEQEKISHSGTGRVETILMRPMSLFESGESTGSISLHDLFDPAFSLKGCPSSAFSEEKLAFAICRGGWPSAVRMGGDPDSLLVAKTIVDGIVEEDMDRGEGEEDDEGKKLGRRKYDPILTRRLIRSYSRHDSTLANNRQIIADVSAKGAYSFSEATFYRYKSRLDHLYVFEDVPSWAALFKEKGTMRASPKHEFSDPSIGIAASGLSPEYLVSHPFDFGFFFEALAIRDLRVYSDGIGGTLYHYHDDVLQEEADAVLVLDDDRYALIEIKKGFGQVKEAADKLVAIRARIQNHNKTAKKDEIMPLPSALIVVYGGNDPLTLSNGVQVVPLSCLRD
jgi:predicted AAA+ superfamily ATPase